ncbi:MAG: TetR/AcrR family transcriptional regulator [Frankia sp.]|nr:TetR/AcrR family transcriptional regulator [Frankia sp.]
MNTPAPRRERLRAATIEEIKETARAQLAEHGLSSISLRGVARAMGLTPSALYRYFDSHDELVRELCADAFSSLADELEASEALTAHEPSGARRWLALARAYRHWALRHQVEYTLLFGPRTLDVDVKSARCGAEMRRALAVLFRCMADQVACGCVDTSHLEAQLQPELREELVAWGQAEGVPISPAALAACLSVWTSLHGALSLELFGHFPPQITDFDDLYDMQMLNVLVRIGYQPSIDIAAVMAPTALPGTDQPPITPEHEGPAPAA